MKSKTITIQATEEEIKAINSVLVDTLDYYNTLNDRTEEMHLLRLSTELTEKITANFYEEE